MKIEWLSRASRTPVEQCQCVVDDPETKSLRDSKLIPWKRGTMWRHHIRGYVGGRKEGRGEERRGRGGGGGGGGTAIQVKLTQEIPHFRRQSLVDVYQAVRRQLLRQEWMLLIRLSIQKLSSLSIVYSSTRAERKYANISNNNNNNSGNTENHTK